MIKIAKNENKKVLEKLIIIEIFKKNYFIHFKSVGYS